MHTEPDRDDPKATAEPEELRVTTSELFFDLVFVFTITQLTALLLAEPNAAGLAKMALLLAVVWWMYGGYAWLTNLVPPVRLMPRLLLLAAMAGYLVIALSVPTAFGSGGVAFGLGYLFVVSVHAGLFLTSVSARRSILRLVPWNLGGAVLLLTAAFLPAPARWALWVLVPAVYWSLPHLRGAARYELRPGHFVERHGLVLIIAFGESVVAIGGGLLGERLTIGLVIAAVLALVVLAALWWSYFGGADELAVQRLSAADVVTRGRLSLAAFGRAYYVMLAGVIVLSAGIRRAIAEPWHPGHPLPALAVGGGVAVYLAGDVALRRALRLGPVLPRCAGLVLAVASIAAGTFAPAAVQLVVIAVVLLVMFVVESPAGGWPPIRPPASAGPPS